MVVLNRLVSAFTEGGGGVPITTLRARHGVVIVRDGDFCVLMIPLSLFNRVMVVVLQITPT